MAFFSAPTILELLAKQHQHQHDIDSSQPGSDFPKRPQQIDTPIKTRSRIGIANLKMLRLATYRAFPVELFRQFALAEIASLQEQSARLSEAEKPEAKTIRGGYCVTNGRHDWLLSIEYLLDSFSPQQPYKPVNT
ncbi:hypothetical protein DTL42_06255 [Bremerella cremea]|uniref:Uncharacterized protein n=1 Tax=Bremerella cremea TaxID=1031537 RepID=A0A368KY73_9BACT|nr:hypothetical protein DTL42_06255 [Bremerella cremea]